MKKTYYYVLLLPGFLFLLFFMLIPIVMTIGSTFFKRAISHWKGIFISLKTRIF